jgi:hypothetical protein
MQYTGLHANQLTKFHSQSQKMRDLNCGSCCDKSSEGVCMKKLLTIVMLISSTSLFAAIPPAVTGMGTLRGGQFNGFYSLVDLRSSYSSKLKIERLVIDFGEANFDKLVGPVGYYQVEVKQNPPRLILNFPKALNTKFEARDLAAKLRNSPYIKNARIDFDRISQAMYLTMDLKKPVIVRAIPVEGKRDSAKLVVDLIDKVNK